MVEGTVYPGESALAMVAWRMTLKTPECPEGRDIVVIANDITVQIGSFGTKDDLLFQRASELARKLKVPRLYLSANSGARIGIAGEVLAKTRIAWEDPSNPEKGFRWV